MKSIVKFLALGVFAASTTLAAHATPLASGAVTITGYQGSITAGTGAGNSVSAATTSLTFSSSPAVYSFGPGSGSLSGVTPGVNPVSPFPVTGSTIVFSTLSVSNPFEFFTVPGTTISFYATNETFVGLNTIIFTGYVNAGTAATDTYAYYTFTPNGDSSLGDFSSDLVIAPTPEPSSLLLLGTGLASAAGMVFRKRRSVIA